MIEYKIIEDTVTYLLLGVMVTASLVAFYYTCKAVLNGECKK